MKDIVEDVVTKDFDFHLQMGRGVHRADRSQILAARRVPVVGDVLRMIETNYAPCDHREAQGNIIAVTPCTESEVYLIAFDQLQLGQ
jgi:hypothetical protein